jgi:hypothetical protein
VHVAPVTVRKDVALPKMPSAVHVATPRLSHEQTATLKLAIRGRLAPAAGQGLAVEHAPAPGRVRPLTDRNGLLKPVPEQVVRLEKARVILADYPLIKHDFGEVLAKRFGKPVNAISNDEIDGWLLDSTAYMSIPQVKQTEVNTPIPYNERQTVTALRPQDYGRALVYEPAPGALIDVKGAGAVNPRMKTESSGLATLGESIREYAYEHLVNKVFIHAGLGDRTVGHYAVIDAGFDVKQPNGGTDPAGLILRQAAPRAGGYLSALGNHDTRRIEVTLRRYGITSAGEHRSDSYDALNLQGSADGAVEDFGGFLVRPTFDKPAYHYDRTPKESPSNKPLLSEDKVFVEPHEDIRVPFNVWGYTATGKADPALDNPSAWSHELARSLRDGRAGRQDAEQHMHNLLDPVDARLQANGPTSR